MNNSIIIESWVRVNKPVVLLEDFTCSRGLLASLFK